MFGFSAEFEYFSLYFFSINKSLFAPSSSLMSFIYGFRHIVWILRFLNTIYYNFLVVSYVVSPVNHGLCFSQEHFHFSFPILWSFLKVKRFTLFYTSTTIHFYSIISPTLRFYWLAPCFSNWVFHIKIHIIAFHIFLTCYHRCSNPHLTWISSDLNYILIISFYLLFL